MVARKYEIYFEFEQDISRVSAANECDVLFKTILCLFYKWQKKIYLESMYLCIIIRGF